MLRTPSHPEADRIELPHVLDCLSDPIRLAIVITLARGAAAELRCGDFNHLSSKSNLSYHMVKLRDAGLIRSRIVGSNHFVQLRKEEIDQRFPGLLEAVIAGARKSASVQRLVDEEEAR